MSKSVFIIAEAGVNHNGDVQKAFELVDIAFQAGADAVKFQTFKAERLTTARAETCDYQEKALVGQKTQQDMLKALELDDQDYVDLAKYCAERNIEFMSTAFDPESLDFLVKETGLKRVKIPSGEMVNPFLLLKAARSGLPIILSTGMAELAEISIALGILAYGMTQEEGFPSQEAALAALGSENGEAGLKKRVTILHCTTEYPTPVNEVNLAAMNTLREEYALATGLSDHSAGIHVSVAAVAMGAEMIEKHFTLDKEMEGPDHKASLSPEELSMMVSQIRDMEQATGSGLKVAGRSEERNKIAARGSLVAARPIAKGEKFSLENVTSKRPADGISPLDFWKIIDQPAKQFYEPDDQIDPNEIG